MGRSDALDRRAALPGPARGGATGSAPRRAAARREARGRGPGADARARPPGRGRRRDRHPAQAAQGLLQGAPAGDAVARARARVPDARAGPPLHGGSPPALPLRELPRSEAGIKAKFGERAEGIGRLPWLVQESYARLVEAMKAGDKEKILNESDVITGLVVDLQLAAQPHRELRRTEDRAARDVGAARREAAPGPGQGAEGLAGRRALPRQPEGVRLLHHAGHLRLARQHPLPGGAGAAGQGRLRRSLLRGPRRPGGPHPARSACPARPRTPAASGTRRGRSPAGPS